MPSASSSCPGAMAFRRLREQLARGIGTQEGLHGALGLGRCDRPPPARAPAATARTAASGRARALGAAARSLRRRGPVCSRRGRAPRGPWHTAARRRARAAAAAPLRAAALAVQRRAEQRRQVRLARELRERVAAELLCHHAVAGAQEGERAFEGGANEPGVGDRRRCRAARAPRPRRRRRSAR